MTGSPRAAPRTSRRRFLRFAGLGTTTTALAGCQAIGNETDTNGTVEGTRRGFTEPFTLGMLTIPTGLGASHTNAMRLAVEHLNQGEGIHDHEQSGIGGQSVDFVLGELGRGASSAKQAYNKVTKKEGADATFGGLNLRTLLPLIADAETLHFSTASPDPFASQLVSKTTSPVESDPAAEYEKYKYFFRAGPLVYDQLWQSAVEVLGAKRQDLGWQNVSILLETSVGDDALVDELKRSFTEDVGVDVPVAQSVSAGQSNWTPIFQNLEDADTDLAFVALVLSGTAFTNQWADQQRSFEAGGINLFAMLPQFWSQTNGAAEALWTMNAMTPQTTNNEPYTQAFMEAYNERFDSYPLFAGPIAYDAIHHYKRAVEALGSRNPEKVIPYLEEEFSYAEGTVIPEFDYTGPTAARAHDPVWESTFESGVPVYQQWQSDAGVDRPSVPGGGIMESFAPEQNKTADYIRPPWLR